VAQPHELQSHLRATLRAQASRLAAAMLPFLALVLPTVLVDIGRGFREAFFMLWETLWALVLGFGLSGAVQAFASREGMQRTLGDHRPMAVLRASGFGAISSSCSYAASAMAKSLFQKGADFVTAMVFMVASTNLVIELGLVLLVLIGWQFTAAEIAGAPLMILLLVLAGGLLLRGQLVETARARLSGAASRDEQGEAACHAAPAVSLTNDHCAASERAMGDGERAMGDGERAMGERALGERALELAPWSEKLRSRAGWADASTYAIADMTMLRKELLIGYLVAGFLAALVPTGIWESLFVTGHGAWTAIENAAVGPLIAMASWVCSVGNVPLAAALWKGGISFGGVVSFVFADLVSMPLVLIYRRLYGGQLALRMVLVLYVAMAVAGLAIGELFTYAGIVPTLPRASVASAHFSWNYTTVLDMVFLPLLAAMWWMRRHREQLGGGAGFAIDPVCHMQVRVAEAPATTTWGGRDYWFCSEHCEERFAANPERFLADQERSGCRGPTSVTEDELSRRLMG